MDDFLPKCSVTLIFWQSLDNKYNFFKKVTILAPSLRMYPLLLLPSAPGLPNTYYHGANASLVGFLAGQNWLAHSFSSRMWQTELGWQEARDLRSSPRCISCDLKRVIISPNPYAHPGLLLQLQIKHGALDRQGHSHSADPKSCLLPTWVSLFWFRAYHPGRSF